MQLALASCALGETQRVPANILTEYAGWLAIAGRADLSQRAMNPEDAGR
jgi:hypothetical protein